MASFRVAVGGLGGGGDSGGALAFAIPLRRKGIEPVFIAFARCSTDTILRAEKYTGAVVKVTFSSWSSGRFFEPHIASLGFETYVICLKEKKRDVIDGLEKLVSELNIRIFISIDLGGDSLVFGDEPLLGSFRTDTLGLASLSTISENLGVRAYLAVGVLGLEGGGRDLDIEYLADNLVKLSESKAYLGSYRPPQEAVSEVAATMGYLLSREKSAMLTLYRDALLGKLGTRRYDVAYLHAEVCVKNYHGYFFVFNALKVCELSKLCKAAREGWSLTLKRVARHRKIRRLKTRRDLDKIAEYLLKRKFDLTKVLAELNK
ncbi:MAG: hypothetical protein DRJ52_10885 [Thermoprotei archaeon]|nr:MAG: hypothetical protein DRJ52_10885 [Thermoprotei archaeon]RLE98425.1 MAG: hypothetical protein DRJ63_07790 [Thermoprotei archaeon]